jgi:hypothetical protein
VNKLAFFLICALPLFAHAEDDGEELLGFMERPASRDVAMAYIDAVRQKWDGVLFCIPGDDPRPAAFAAVKTWLDAHPADRYRPRRYLITEGLREGFPCPAK